MFGVLFNGAAVLSGGIIGLLFKKGIPESIEKSINKAMGIGVMFSFVPVVIYQGTICLLAGLLSNVLEGELLIQVCMVGFTLIICVGLNLMTNIKFKTVNMLPSLLLPIIYYGVMKLL